MIPLLQTQRHVAPTTNHDLSKQSSASPHVPRNEEFFPSTPSAYDHSFPIRSAPPYHLANGHVTNNVIGSEHHLRRKTPNGTLDFRFGPFPNKPSPDEPPLKQMALSGPSASQPVHHMNDSTHIRHPSFSSNYGRPTIDNGQMMAPSSWPFNSAMPTNPGMVNHPGANFQFCQPPQQLAGAYPSIYQPVIRANEYNVRAFCPPPPAFGWGGMPFAQASWQPGVSPSWDAQNNLNQGFYPHNQQPLHHMHHASPVNIPQNYIPDLLPPSNTHHQFQATGPELSGHQAPAEVSLESQQHFRERTLSQAYRCYLRLLGYSQAVKRVQYAKDGTGVDSMKHLSFPKPPRPKRENLSLRMPSRTHTNVHAPSHSLDNFPAMGQSGSSIITTGQPYSPHHMFQQQQHNHTPVVQDLYAGVDQFRAQTPRTYPSALPPKPNNYQVNEPNMLDSARSSLELLKSLCEQAPWTWTDGMLLVGCLHYALEEYAQALHWFSRIVTEEPNHVESIANMAAALYSLGRQSEAEQQWVRSLKLRPSYMEAAEHLVGLLYKKRSREAIEIINFVQTALRLETPQPSSTQTGGEFQQSGQSVASYRSTPSHYTDTSVHTNKTRPFGSSGYALSPDDNGRILALVHAKGTMLYGLKNVQGAADAFEEAVLIGAGRSVKGIRDLVARIRAALLRSNSSGALEADEAHHLQPLLLTPDKARHTARLVFGGDGGLPGLSAISDPVQKRAALQTTSNALLSLAKIFQDSMAAGNSDTGLSRPPSGVGDILALYYLSLALQESPSTANNVGILLAGIQQTSKQARNTPTSQQSIQGVPPGSGLELALSYYYYGLRLDPKHVHLHTNLGSLLKDVGQLDHAIQMYERAVSCDGTFDIALTNLANAVKDKGRVNDAIGYYKRAIQANPSFAEAVCGLFTALNSVCDWRGRGGVVLEAGKYDRWHVGDDGALVDVKITNNAVGLTQRVVDIVHQQLQEASSWGKNTLIEATQSSLVKLLQPLLDDQGFNIADELRKWAIKSWEGSRVVRLVERSTRVALRKWYLQKYVDGDQAVLEYKRIPLPACVSVPSAPTVLPFHTFTCPLSAKDIRLISQRNAMRISCSTLRSPWFANTISKPPPPPKPHLNVGYVSSDFSNHPLAHLMQSVFGFHNRDRVQAFCYATTPSDNSSYRLQIERESPFFRDASSWTPDRLIRQIIDDNIHILVNLNGYTRGARNEIFAARPAPLQISFMGYAGTLGAEWCDYLLADTMATPPETLRPYRNNVTIEDVFRDKTEDDEEDWLYSENIIFCKDTFFCCDHAQSSSAGERDLSWEDEECRRWKMRKELFPSLPDDAVLLGNFNQLYKIEPTIFRTWLRILASVPKAFLWLLRFPEAGEANLRRTAEAWAGAEVASRLMFTDVAPKGQHISRARVCDLFLDTPECNAHTTAADVLWSSTPLLTLPRYSYKMCSRMAASILQGALPKNDEGEVIARELITQGESEYEDKAIELASSLSYLTSARDYCSGHGRLAEMRKLLWESKWTCGLFDTRRWVRDLEDAYDEAWRRWVKGEGGDIYL